MAGAGIRKSQELLGHKHVNTTQIYDKRRAVSLSDIDTLTSIANGRKTMLVPPICEKGKQRSPPTSSGLATTPS
jgi:hypothetical protein